MDGGNSESLSGEILPYLDKTGKTLHVENQKFGFRTIETRESDGLYINGRTCDVRGVNRHSFRPESGRTLSKAKKNSKMYC